MHLQGRSSSSDSEGSESVIQSVDSLMEKTGLAFRRTDLLVVLSLQTFLSFLCLLGGPTGPRGLAAGLEDETVPPCTGGYGVLDETNDVLELDDNEGCNFLNGEVPYFNDTCVKLLEQGPCAPGEWLVIDNDEDIMKCKRRECLEGEVMYEDKCHALNDDNDNPCEPTFELIINDQGKGECECHPGHLYHPPTHQCYVPYTRGPCRPGFIIKVEVHEHGGLGECERNPCPKEKMTPLDHRCLPRDAIFFARCYTIGLRAPCKDGSFLLIEPSLAKPFCLPYKPNSITAPRQKRWAPCLLGYRHSCARKCEGPDAYPFRGSCRQGYAYFYSGGSAPMCVRGRCTRTYF